MAEFRFKVSNEQASDILELLRGEGVVANPTPQTTRSEQIRAYAAYIDAYRLKLESLLEPNSDPQLEETRLQRYPELIAQSLGGSSAQGSPMDLRAAVVGILAEPTLSDPIFHSSKGPQYAYWMGRYVMPRFGYALISRFGLDRGEQRDFKQVSQDLDVSPRSGTARVFVKEGLAQFRNRFIQRFGG